MGRPKKVPSNKRLHTCGPRTGADPGQSRAKRSANVGSRSVEAVGDGLLPRGSSVCVVLVTWAFRVYYVISPSSWWVLHPDEIFQTLEVAHTELYGYGVRPYEFLGPAKGDNMSLLEMKEKELGMWTMRSPIVPQFFMMISSLASVLGFEPNPYLLWRVAHVSVTSWLPLAFCTYVTSVTNSRDAGNLAAILTSISSHVTVLGTHTLVNSFVSPFLFLSLAHVTRLLRDVTKALGEKPQRFSQPADGNTVPTDPAISKPKWTTEDSMTPVHYARSESQRSKLSDPGYCTGLDENGISDNDSQSSRDNINNDDSENVNVEDMMQRLTGSTDVKELRRDKADAPQDSNESHGIHQNLRDLASVLAGLVLALCMYVRPDASLPVLLLILPHLRAQTMLTLLRKKTFWCHLLGAMIGVAFAVADDFYFFGSFVLSPVNWVRFNLFSGQTSRLFGSSGKYFYFEHIFFKDLGSSVLTLMFTSAMISLVLSDVLTIFNKFVGFLKTPNVLSSESVSKLTGCHGLRGHMASVIFLVGIYSAVGHKECRFLHDTIVLFLGVVSMIIASAYRSVTSPRHIKRSVLLVLGSLFLANQWTSLHDFEKRSPMARPHSSPGSGPYINQCLYYISTQTDVTGMYMEHSLLEHGSFTLLHKHVPVLFLHDRQFIEFDRGSLISDTRYCWPGTNCTSDYYAMFSVSDLIEESNHDFILKRIIESKHYNYAVIASDKEFFKPLFTKVFAAGNFAVWKRNRDPAEEEKLSKLSSRIPYGGSNVTLVELEGEVLKLYRSHHAAFQRFDAALRRGRDHASVYASMAFCLHRMGQWAEWMRVLRRCKQKYSEGECMDGSRVRVIKGIL